MHGCVYLATCFVEIQLCVSRSYGGYGNGGYGNSMYGGGYGSNSMYGSGYGGGMYGSSFGSPYGGSMYGGNRPMGMQGKSLKLLETAICMLMVFPVHMINYM